MSDEELETVVNHLKREDYSDFQALNRTIQQSILRAETYRISLKNHLISNEREFSSAMPQIQAHYASNEAELLERQRSRLWRFYLYHQTRSDLSTWERKEKVILSFR